MNIPLSEALAFAEYLQEKWYGFNNGKHFAKGGLCPGGHLTTEEVYNEWTGGKYRLLKEENKELRDTIAKLENKFFAMNPEFKELQ